MPNVDSVENGLISTLMSRMTLLNTNNFKRRGADEVISYLLQNPSENYGAYTMFGGGSKSGESGLIWTWNIRLVFLVRASQSSASIPENRLQTLLEDLDLDEWRKISRLGNTCLASRISSISEPELISYNNILFYQIGLTVEADVRYADALS